MDEPDDESVVAPPPTVEITVRPMEFVVVTTSPAVSDGEEEDVVAAADVIDPISDGLVLTVVPGGAVSDPEVVEDSPPRGTGNTRVVAGSGDCCAGVVGTVPLLCRLASLAIFSMPVATPGSSLWIASTAVRSSGNMPCLNFLGEKSWSAACRDGGSAWSSSF